MDCQDFWLLMRQTHERHKYKPDEAPEWATDLIHYFIDKRMFNNNSIIFEMMSEKL